MISFLNDRTACADPIAIRPGVSAYADYSAVPNRRSTMECLFGLPLDKLSVIFIS
jgi:hypothetical protein